MVDLTRNVLLQFSFLLANLKKYIWWTLFLSIESSYIPNRLQHALSSAAISWHWTNANGPKGPESPGLTHTHEINPWSACKQCSRILHIQFYSWDTLSSNCPDANESRRFAAIFTRCILQLRVRVRVDIPVHLQQKSKQKEQKKQDEFKSTSSRPLTCFFKTQTWCFPQTSGYIPRVHHHPLDFKKRRYLTEMFVSQCRTICMRGGSVQHLFASRDLKKNMNNIW